MSSRNCGRGALRRPGTRRTIRRWRSCGRRESGMRYHAQKQTHSFQLRDMRARAEYIVIPALDLSQNLHAAAAEQFEIDGKPAVHHAREGQTADKELASDLNRFGHDRAETLVITMREKVF